VVAGDGPEVPASAGVLTGGLRVVRMDRVDEPSIVAEAARRRAAAAWLWATVLLTAGAFIAAEVLAPPASAAPPRGLVWLLFLGSSVHVASTGWLARFPEVRAHAARHLTRYVGVPVGLIVGGAVAAALCPTSKLAWVILPYFAWQFFHFQKQNLGMAALAAASRRVAALRTVERRALMSAGVAGIVGLLARPGLLQLRLDPRMGALFAGAGVVFAGAVGTGLVALVLRPATDRPLAFCVVYLLALLFSLPIFVCTSPYASVGGMTVAHGLQYLLLMGLVAGRSRWSASRTLPVVVFVNLALIGGVALSAASHLHDAGPAGRLVFGAYLGVVTAHFVVDAGVWRLRDPFPRSFVGRYLPFLHPAHVASQARLPIDR